MKCNRVKLLLSSFQDNELTEKERAEIFLHLKKCEKCKHELEQLESLKKEIKNLNEFEPIQNFTSLVMDKINRKKRFNIFSIPSLVYSFTFILFFILGFLINVPLKNNVENKQKEVYISTLLMQGQELSLINVQDKTFNMLYNGDLNEK